MLNTTMNKLASFVVLIMAVYSGVAATFTIYRKKKSNGKCLNFSKFSNEIISKTHSHSMNSNEIDALQAINKLNVNYSIYVLIKFDGEQ